MRKELASAVNFSYMDAGGDGGDIHKEFFSTLRSPLETILKALEQAEIDPEHPYALVVKVPGLRNPLMPFYHLPNACILALAPRPDKKQVIFNISTDLEAKYARWTAYCNFCEEHQLDSSDSYVQLPFITSEGRVIGKKEIARIVFTDWSALPAELNNLSGLHLTAPYIITEKLDDGWEGRLWQAALGRKVLIFQTTRAEEMTIERRKLAASPINKIDQAQSAV